MAIEFPSDIPAISKQLLDFMMQHGGELPAHTRATLLEYGQHPSPVERIVNSAEALYAVKGELGKEGRDMGAKLAQFAAGFGWHGMSERGIAMSAALQRIGGYSPPPGTSWPDAESDPAPLERFLEKTEDEPAAPPPAPPPAPTPGE